MNLMGIAEEARKSRVILVSKRYGYRDDFISIMQDIQRSGKRIGYITIKRSYDLISKEMLKNRIESGRFFFVDAITATLNVPPIVGNCIFVSSPSSLTELKVAFSSLFEEKNREIICFDSISELLEYNEQYEVVKFIHGLIMITHTMNRKAVFIVREEDSGKLVKDVSMFADKLINL